MRNNLCISGLVAALAACAPATAITTSTPPDTALRDAFFDALRTRDDARVEVLLAATPALAESTNVKGRSAFVVALGRGAGEGFVRPQDNRALAAILARRPALDPLEAAASGDLARVEAEIAKDAGYVRRVHAIGWTPLHFAAFGGQPRVAETLLAHGADVDARATNEFANTPLQVALLTVQEEVARVLIAHRADVNAKQREGFTALHEAAQSGSSALVRLLLDAGADPSSRTEKGQTPALVARDAKHEDVAALLHARGGRD